MNDLTRKYPSKKIAKGTIILKPGEEISHLFSIDSGFIKLYKKSSSNTQLNLHIFKPGAIIPLMLVLGKETNSYYFEAATDAEIKSIPKTEVITWLKNHPEQSWNLANNFAAGLRGMIIRVEGNINHNVYKNMVSLLIYFAESFGVTDSDSSIKFKIKLTHSEISSWIGAARETVSRQIEKLKKNKLITYEGHNLIVLDIDKLKEELN